MNIQILEVDKKAIDTMSNSLKTMLYYGLIGLKNDCLRMQKLYAENINNENNSLVHFWQKIIVQCDVQIQYIQNTTDNTVLTLCKYFSA